MKLRSISKTQAHIKTRVRITYTVLLFSFMIFTIASVFIMKTKERAFETAFLSNASFNKNEQSVEMITFPIGVDPERKTITENPIVDTYYQQHLSANIKRPNRDGWLAQAMAKLVPLGWYQNLASPVSRILVVQPGERKEQIAKNFADILLWDREMRLAFIELVTTAQPELSEGKFYPAHYVVSKEATPEAVALILTERFNSEVVSRYSNDIDSLVPLADTLTIASLLEREAYDFEDMRQIAGVIWNRLFIDMNLQIDATLQYAKGSNPSEPKWWPVPRPRDKYIESPYNTYQNGGLPPGPISNPAPDAILAALNPKNTDCLFYFHDADSNFHCTPTYEEHVALLKKYYGRGK